MKLLNILNIPIVLLLLSCHSAFATVEIRELKMMVTNPIGADHDIICVVERSLPGTVIKPGQQKDFYARPSCKPVDITIVPNSLSSRRLAQLKAGLLAQAELQETRPGHYVAVSNE